MLNDDTLAEFGSTPVELPNQNKQAEFDTTIITGDNVQHATLSEQARDVLAKSDVTVKIINDGVAHVVDLAKVENSIATENAVNRHTAELINDTFGNFFGPRLAVEHFSQVPSQVNYQFSVRFMANAIAAESAEVVSQFSDFAGELLNSLISVSSTMEKVVQETEEAFRQMKAELTALANEIKSNPNVIFSSTAGFINILTQDIRSIDWDNVKLTETSTTLQHPSVEFVKSISNVVKLMKMSSVLPLYITMVTNAMPFEDLSKEEEIARHSGKAITLQVLLDFLTNDEAIVHFKTACDRLFGEASKLKSLTEDETKGMDFMKVQEYMSEHTPTLTYLYEQGTWLLNVSVSMRSLIQHFVCVSQFLKML